MTSRERRGFDPAWRALAYMSLVRSLVSMHFPAVFVWDVKQSSVRVQILRRTDRSADGSGDAG
jgi:hypothetical protein